MNKFKKGFTMIELLIVVAVLGILAVAVLAAINPIEQINRGKDTGSRSDAEQLIGAVDRYYTANGFYPWEHDEADTDFDAPWAIVNNSWLDDNTPAEIVLDKLSSGGTAEVKESFINRISATSYNSLYKWHKGGVGESTYICFLPKSSNFQTEAGTRCTNALGLPSDFPAAACPGGCAAAKTCYLCLP